jgi:hypothetical protein
VSNYYPKIGGKTLYFEFNLLSQSQYISDLSLSSHFILSFSLSQVFPFHAQTTQRRKNNDRRREMVERKRSMEEPVSDFLYNHLYIYLSLLLNLWFLFVYIISPEKKIAQREEELERLVMTDSFTVKYSSTVKSCIFFSLFLLLFICFVSLSGICSGWVSGEKQKNIRHVVGERKYSR